MTVPLQRSPFLMVKQVVLVGRFCEVIKRFRLQTVQVPFHIVALFVKVCCVILRSATVGVVLAFDSATFTVSTAKTVTSSVFLSITLDHHLFKE